MKKSILLIIGMLMFFSSASSQTWYLVRHAEKVDDGSKDPILTAQGIERANNIANMLAHAGIEKIYATAYQRTQLTAAPLAQYLNIEVSEYDPSQLPAFADQLKAETGNALIVGHSNTTPMMAYLLSGQATTAFDEVNYDPVIQIIKDQNSVAVNWLHSMPSHVTQPLSQIKLDPARFFQGQLTFNMKLNGDVVGQSVHSFSQQSDEFHLHEKTTIEAYKIDADIQAVVRQNDLSPISMSMRGSMGSPVDIQLKWQDSQVIGHSEMARAPFQAQGKIDINTQLKPLTLERTSAIMLAHLMPVAKNKPLTVNWFNGYGADQRLIHISYEGEEQITVPAGTFDTYKIKYSGGAPSQYYWIDQEQPKVVKIDVIKSPWSYDLVKADIE